MDEKYIYIMLVTTRKSINTNRNTEGITVRKKIKTKQKKNDVSFFTNRITNGIIPSVFSKEL